MLIGICGTKCAGKSTVAQYLVDHHGFKKLHLDLPEDSLVEDSQNGTSNSTSPDSGSASASRSPVANGKSAAALPYQPRITPPTHTFTSIDALLDFVTQSWRSRWVLSSVSSESVLDALSRRPFFILISVDAPLTVRWRRYQALHSASSSSSSSSSSPSSSSPSPASLEDFVLQSDAHLYHPTAGVLPLLSRATIRLLNTSADLAHLYATLGKLDLTNAERLRPSWDAYFMSLASLAARRANCMKRAVGCVLVGASRRVISTGYNGTPRELRNCSDGGCPRCNGNGGGGGGGEVFRSGQGLATCLCLHAEENALLEAGRERIREGSTLYCNTCPCLTCSIKIVQVGISEVVYSQGYSMDGDTAEVFRSAGVKLRQFSPPANGLIHLEKMDLY